MFCNHCGKELYDQAVICPNCGCAVNGKSVVGHSEEKQWTVAFVLAWFLGAFGAHRFYLGQTGLAVLQLLTLGGCGIWSFIDIVVLALDNYKVNGVKPSGYNKTLAIVWFILFVLGLVLSFGMGLLGALSEIANS